jgi:hypothetical protein
MHHSASGDDMALDRLIARALVAEPRANVGRMWHMVPEARTLRADELRERMETQRRRAHKVHGWLQRSNRLAGE